MLLLEYQLGSCQEHEFPKRNKFVQFRIGAKRSGLRDTDTDLITQITHQCIHHDFSVPRSLTSIRAFCEIDLIATRHPASRC